MPSSQILSEAWTAETLDATGQWCLAHAGPDHDSVQEACTALWRQGARGVRKISTCRTVAAERVRRAE